MTTAFTPTPVYDFIGSFEAGVNSGVSPLLLDKNQMAEASNTTVRGTFVTHRPVFKQITLNNDALTNATLLGPFQGAGYIQPDNANEGILLQIGGRQFRIIISGNAGSVSDVTIPGDPNPVTQPQVWIWQTQRWAIVTDGISKTIFHDVDTGTSVRSNYGAVLQYNTTTASTFTVPATNATVIGVTVTNPANINVGDLLTLAGVGIFAVQSVVGAVVDLLNVSGLPVGKTVYSGTSFSWQHIGSELPPGRMGAYVMGRNWMCLTNGKQFIASDLVGGSSGTLTYGYDDAVLKVTENAYLAGGGFFSVPGSVGLIRSIQPAATLDASLGQGPVQIFAPDKVFSCNAPVDRLTWQSLANPILTESLLGNGALSQNCTVNVNGDLMFRSPNGLASLILARREFDTWGNTPISYEVGRIFDADNPSLLNYSSAIEFNNRLLVTAQPTSTPQGTQHYRIVPLNFDLLTTLRGKAPAVYDAEYWDGMNVFQLVAGEFNSVKRAFALTWNTYTSKVELWEILRDGADIVDGGNIRILWALASGSLFKEQQQQLGHQLLRLTEGEIYVDDLKGTVDFRAYYKPDQWPCWIPWFSWSECQTPATKDVEPGFRPRMGLGEPSASDCDTTNNRPLREGYTFQFKLLIRGHCRFLGARIGAVTVPQPKFAKQGCDPICQT